MNFLRLLARFFFWFALLAVVVMGLCCVPSVQTWIAHTALARHPEYGATVGEVSVGWGTLKITDLKYTTKTGAVLTAPVVDAHFPVRAWWQRAADFESISAKDWTLDIGNLSDDFFGSPLSTASAGQLISRAAVNSPPGGANSGVANSRAERIAEDDFPGVLGQIVFPVDLAIDAIEWDGEILATRDNGKTKIRSRVLGKGGAIGKGREGKLAVSYSGTATYLEGGLQILQFSGESQWTMAMATPRTVKNLAVAATLAAKGGAVSRDFSAALQASAERNEAGEAYALKFIRDDRPIATIEAKWAVATRRFDGTWKLNVEPSDWESFASNRGWPTLAWQGQGEFSRELTSGRFHVQGAVDAVARNVGSLFPSLASAEALTFHTQFDASRVENTIHVDRLQVAVAAAEPIGVLRATQIFDLDAVTGKMTMADPTQDFASVSLQRLPLAWFSGSNRGLTISGGEVSGELKLKAEGGVMALRSDAPLIASQVSLQNDGRGWADQLELTSVIAGTRTAEGWQLECAPISVSHDGKKLGSLEIKWTKSVAPKSPIKSTGKWTADLTVLRSLPGSLHFGWEDARSASGSFSTTSGNPAKWTGDILVDGVESAQSLSANFSAEVGSNQVMTFRAPIKVSQGAKSSEVTAEGTWSRTVHGSWIDLRVGGKDAKLDQLRVLFGPFLAGGKSTLGGINFDAAKVSAAAVATRDETPFWGDLTGKLNLGFDQLQVGESAVKGVRATLVIEPKAVRIQTGLYSLPDQGLARVDGTLAFDAAAERPYQLQLTLADSDVDGATIFPPPKAEHDPIFHGKFSVGSKVTGSGVNLDDLVTQTEEEYRLKSTSGIIRFLKTNVADTMKQPVTPVGDALGTMGSLVGKIFGRNDVEKGEIRLGKNADGVIDFSYRVAELGYQDIAITAARTAKGTVLLKMIAMTAGDLRVSGSGEISYVPKLKLSERPLRAELKFAVRGKLKELLELSGLLSVEKDADGYTAFAKSMVITGTLNEIDIRAWHDLLAEGANRPDPPKKAVAKK